MKQKIVSTERYLLDFSDYPIITAQDSDSDLDSDKAELTAEELSLTWIQFLKHTELTSSEVSIDHIFSVVSNYKNFSSWHKIPWNKQKNDMEFKIKIPTPKGDNHQFNHEVKNLGKKVDGFNETIRQFLKNTFHNAFDSFSHAATHLVDENDADGYYKDSYPGIGVVLFNARENDYLAVIDTGFGDLIKKPLRFAGTTTMATPPDPPGHWKGFDLKHPIKTWPKKARHAFYIGGQNQAFSEGPQSHTKLFMTKPTFGTHQGAVAWLKLSDELFQGNKL
jgi:hypothetical protein